MWKEGAFALRPLDGSDDYKLEVEFVWQTRYKLPSSSNVDLLKVARLESVVDTLG